MGGDHHWPEVEVRLRVQLHRAGERLHPVPRVLQGRVRDLFKIILVILGFLSSFFYPSFFTGAGARERTTARSSRRSTVRRNVTAAGVREKVIYHNYIEIYSAMLQWQVGEKYLQVFLCANNT